MLSFINVKGQTFAVCFSNVRICCFSLIPLVVNRMWVDQTSILKTSMGQARATFQHFLASDRVDDRTLLTLFANENPSGAAKLPY